MAQTAIKKATKRLSPEARERERERNRGFWELWHKADLAGRAAAANARPVPMVVQQHEHVLDDTSPVTQQWYVPEGVCGFAWVVLRPATSSFARYLKSREIADKHYYGGLSIWCPLMTQSLARKEAWARVVAQTLRDAGYNAWMESRLD